MVDTFMVFDVESIGLHGEGFAVGWVVITRAGERLDEGYLACHPLTARGTLEGGEWVAQHVPTMEFQCDTPRSVREGFWRLWRHWAEKGALLVADCAWPVEARFMAMTIEDAMPEREWQGPYPLHDLASVLLAVGHNPLARYERTADELPVHHPLMDARQSARLLVESLNGIRG
jgi:hypothetical protein